MRLVFFALLFAATLSAQGTPAISFEQLTITNTASGLAADTYSASGRAPAQRCIGYLEGAPIRVRVDGTAPTASVGTLVPIGAKVEVLGLDNIRAFRAIRTGSVDAVLPMTCYAS